MDDPVYIHTSSNHRNNIIKELPKSINKRISEISSTEEIYKDAMPLYEKALKTSGFKNTRNNYTAKQPPNKFEEQKRKRKRKITGSTLRFRCM